METDTTFRMTQQRQIIMEELRKVRTHPTADEVYELVRKRLPRISLGTVYRNLELLSGHGFVNKLEVSGVKKRFDGDISLHHHVRCVDCGRVGDINISPKIMIEEQIENMTHYEILGHNLEFIGRCPECRTDVNALTS